MARRRKANETHIHLNTYNSIEGAVLILANSYDWFVTPQTFKKEKQNIIQTMMLEQRKKRILVLLENKQQIFGSGLL